MLPKELRDEYKAFSTHGFRYVVVCYDYSSVAWFCTNWDALGFIDNQVVPSNYRVLTKEDFWDVS